MAAQTGRTVSQYTLFYVDDSGGTLRSIAVDSINGVGLDYPEVDVSAFYDAVKGVLLDTPSCTINITGPVDTTASTGSHVVLSGIVGLQVPLALDVRIGMRHVWESGEPTFGITGTAANGFLCKSYSVDPGTGKYAATFVVAAGSAIPAWATTAHT